MAICTDAKEPSFDEKNPDKVDKIIVCQKTQIAPQFTHWSRIIGRVQLVSNEQRAKCRKVNFDSLLMSKMDMPDQCATQW